MHQVYAKEKAAKYQLDGFKRHLQNN